MSKIRIDVLNGTIFPQRDHEVPAIREGISVKLRAEQILAVGNASDPQALKDFSNVDPATGRTALGLGTAAQADIGTGSDQVPTNAELPDADGIDYDNSTSGLAAVNVQDALDELAGADGAGLTLLAVQTVSTAVATVEFTSDIDETYDEYEVTFHGVVPSSDDQGFALRVSTDGGSAYRASDYLSVRQSANTVGGNSSNNATTFIFINDFASTGGVSNVAANGGLSGAMRFRPNGTSAKKVFNGECAYRSSGAGFYSVRSSGVWNGGNDAINAIRLYFNAGNIAAGTFRLWGRRKDV